MKTINPSCHPDKPYYAKGLCKSCYTKARQSRLHKHKWYMQNRERLLKANKARYTNYGDHYRVYGRKRELKRKYNISLEDYEALLTSQNGICAVCGGAPKKYRLAVDHNHITNKVRGLLCIPCNVALGKFELYEDKFNNYRGAK